MSGPAPEPLYRQPGIRQELAGSKILEEDKDYVKREYEIATELGKLMRAIDPAMRQGIVFKVLYYRYYNFDLDQPFQPQYEQNNRHLLADLHRIAGEQ